MSTPESAQPHPHAAPPARDEPDAQGARAGRPEAAAPPRRRARGAASEGAPAGPVATPSFADAYRGAVSALPTGVCVLTAGGSGSGGSGRLSAITVGSALDVSYDPPTMAVAVYSGSRMMELLDTARTLTLSVLAADQRGIAQWLGTPGQPSYGLLDGIELVPGEHGPAHVAGCAAHFEISIAQRVEIATHTLLAGPVLACGARPGARPLIRWSDGYTTSA